MLVSYSFSINWIFHVEGMIIVNLTVITTRLFWLPSSSKDGFSLVSNQGTNLYWGTIIMEFVERYVTLSHFFKVSPTVFLFSLGRVNWTNRNSVV